MLLARSKRFFSRIDGSADLRSATAFLPKAPSLHSVPESSGMPWAGVRVGISVSAGSKA